MKSLASWLTRLSWTVLQRRPSALAGRNFVLESRHSFLSRLLSAWCLIRGHLYSTGFPGSVLHWYVVVHTSDARQVTYFRIGDTGRNIWS